MDKFTFYSAKIFEDLTKIMPNDDHFDFFFIGPHEKNDHTWLSDNPPQNAKQIWYFGHYVRKLFSYIKKEKPDIVHFSFEWRTFGPVYATLKFPFLLFLLRFGTNTKIIFNPHAIAINKYEKDWRVLEYILPKKYPKFIFILFVKVLMKTLCTLSHKVIADTPASKLGLKEFYGIPEEKITVNEFIIPPNDTIINNEKKEKFSKQFIQKNIILCFGVISPRKSLDSIIRAFSKVAKDIPDHILVIAGLTTDDNKIYENMLRELTITLEVKDRVFFTGFVDDEESEILFDMAEMALYIYRPHSETSGTLFPAIYHNTPCIVTESILFYHIFSENDVLFTKYNDENQLSKQILKLATNSELKTELKHNMKKLSDKILEQSTANEYFKTYQGFFE